MKGDELTDLALSFINDAVRRGEDKAKTLGQALLDESRSRGRRDPARSLEVFFEIAAIAGFLAGRCEVAVEMLREQYGMELEAPFAEIHDRCRQLSIEAMRAAPPPQPPTEAPATCPEFCQAEGCTQAAERRLLVFLNLPTQGRSVATDACYCREHLDDADVPHLVGESASLIAEVDQVELADVEAIRAWWVDSACTPQQIDGIVESLGDTLLAWEADA